LNKYIPFTGIGAEHAPKHITDVLTEIGYLLAVTGRTLRSGGSKGCSMAFEAGANNAFKKSLCEQRPLTPKVSSAYHPVKEIFLPYRGFENHADDAYFEYDNALKARIIGFIKSGVLCEHFDEIQNPFLIKDYVARVFQLLGKTLNKPSKFMICWSPDGARTHEESSPKIGQTYVSICLAEILKIQTFNMENKSDFDKIVEWRDKMKKEILKG
jgi:hypothetical protein